MLKLLTVTFPYNSTPIQTGTVDSKNLEVGKVETLDEIQKAQNKSSPEGHNSYYQAGNRNWHWPRFKDPVHIQVENSFI